MIKSFHLKNWEISLAYNIKYKSSVIKDLNKLDKVKLKRLLNKIERELSNNPGKDKMLSGNYKGLFSYRIGNYRVIYTVLKNKETILILKIGDRKDIYRK